MRQSSLAKYLTVIPSLSYLLCSWCYVAFGHFKINTSGTSRHHEEAVSHHAVLFYYISQQGDDSLPHLNRSENIHLFSGICSLHKGRHT